MDTIKQVNDIVVYLVLNALEPIWSNHTLLDTFIIANTLRSWLQQYDTILNQLIQTYVVFNMWCLVGTF